MEILLTGVAGFIGSHLAERLLAAGHTVVGLDNFDDFYDPATKERNLEVARGYDRFFLVRGDIRDPSCLAVLPSDLDTVVHLAARAGVRPSIAQPVLYNEVNVTGTLHLLEWARMRRISRFLFASSSSVYGNNRKVPFHEDDRVDHPISPYAATKKAGELLCHTYTHLYGMSCLALRFFTVFGPRQRPDLAIHKFARLMVAGEEIPIYGDGSTSRDYTYIDDIVDGVLGGLGWLAAREASYEIVNLGESRTVSLAEMVRVLSETLGVEPRLRPMPPQPGDVERTFADITKARQLWGYAPRWGFREGVEAFVRWLEQT